MSWLERRVPPPIVMLACAGAMWGVAQRTTRLVQPDGAVYTLTAASALLALGLVGAAFLGFRRAGTTVDPLPAAAPSALVTSGIYRYTRNPMYLALACLLHGWAVWLRAPWALLGLPVFIGYITRWQILPEERALAARFGASYHAYRSRVGRWF